MPARPLVILSVTLLVSMAALSSTAAASPIKATDYSKHSHWLSLPSKITKEVDVFYLYPSAYTKSSSSQPNICPVNDPGMMQGAQVAFSRQATAFAPYANIYAPYYRQADASWSLSLPPAEHIKVEKGEPTHDGIAAFDYYILHYNHGRPFILAAHSQGSNVMIYLLSQYMRSHPKVYKRMIVAYIPGYSVTSKYLAQNRFLKFAKGAHDTGVIVSWNTEAPTIAAPDPVVLPGALAINPITWTRKKTVATAAQNLGSIQLDPATGGRPVLDANGQILRVLNLADARVDTAKGAVICSTVNPADYYFGFPLGVYHTFDYPFYFFNIRANAADRIRHYFHGKGAPADELITEPQAGYQRIYGFISSARKTLDMTMYSLVDPKAIAALIADSQRGVAVRVLLDSTSGNKAANQPAYDALKAAGVKVRWSWPGVLWHQKSMVRDARAVAVMSCNLDAAYYPVIRGWIVITSRPATAAGVEATFSADFQKNRRSPARGVAPRGSELIWSPGAQSPLVKLIGSACPGTTLYAEDEQLDSAAIVQALVAAARRGVTVDLTMSDSPYWVTSLNTLVAGGVHVSLYAVSAPIYIQSKAISVNDRTVYVGSINFTTAMMNADRNMGIITTDPTVVRGITSTLRSDFLGAAPYSGALAALALPNVTR